MRKIQALRHRHPNPLLLASWIAAFFSRRIPALILSLAALGLAGSFMFETSVITNEAGMANPVTGDQIRMTNRDWAFEMLRKFNVPTNIFPEVVPPGTRLGSRFSHAVSSWVSASPWACMASFFKAYWACSNASRWARKAASPRRGASGRDS